MSSYVSRLGALLAIVVLAAACSEDPVAAPADEAATPTTIAAPTSSEAPATTAAPSTTRPTAETVPDTLAFTSTRDLGRFFEIDASAETTTPSSEPDGTADLSPLANGTIVQAVSAKSRGGQLWVQLVDVDGGNELGWLPAASLIDITETIFQTDADAIGQFQRVVRVRSSSFLNIRSAPESGADAVGQLGPDATFMHGGRTATAPDGTRWVDVINSTDRSVIGWVAADFATVADGVEVQTAAGTDVASRAESGATYGASIASAAITSVGCNSVQITVTAASGAQGARLLVGPSEPAAFENNDTVRWAIEGGREAYLTPGSTAVMTVPSTASFTWWILPLDDDGAPVSTTATGGGTVLNAGLATAAQAFAYPISASYCGDAPSDESGFTVPGLEVQSSGVDPAAGSADSAGTNSGGTSGTAGAGGSSESDDGSTTDDGDPDNSGPSTTVPAISDPPSAAPDGFSTTGGDR